MAADMPLESSLLFGTLFARIGSEQWSARGLPRATRELMHDHDGELKCKQALHRLNLEEHLQDRAIKQRYVTTVFDTVASTYDRFTRAFSCGMDKGWKRELMAMLESTVPSDAVVLDVATGTGDLARAAAPLVPRGTVIGMDISERMLAAGRAPDRAQLASQVALCRGDMVCLPVRDESVDIVMVGYGFRNAPDYEATLEEIGRVLKPGGRLLSLDFYRPSNALWRIVFLHYLRFMGSLMGWLWHREPAAYGYIASSIEYFVSGEKFSAALEGRGFVVQALRPKLFGGICLHLARKPLG